MSKLIQAIQTKDTLTENGAVTHSTSNNPLLDLFFTIGAMRNSEKNFKIKKFIQSFKFNPLYTMKLLFFARDCRGGLGERESFREMYLKLYELNETTFINNLQYIPMYGRWDDLIYLMKIRKIGIQKKIVRLLQSGLMNKETRLLVGKWMPRETGKDKKIAIQIASLLKLNMKEYRQLISKNSETVEQLICKKEWDKIKYESVPSLAMNKYTKSFLKNDYERFSKYIEEVKKGNTKINASVLNPCDIVRNIMDNKGTSEFFTNMNNLWGNLPNYFDENSKKHNILPVCDISGSMTMSKSTTKPIHVSIGLSIYLAEKNEGIFKNHYLTFSDEPTLQEVIGNNIKDKIDFINTRNVGYNTDLYKTFKLVLDKAIENKLTKEDLPSHILVISDMEFDDSNVSFKHNNKTNYECIKDEFESYGYELPKLVFWNVDAKSENIPVKETDDGVVLVSGYTPSIISNILNIDTFNPINLMMNALRNERYKDIKIYKNLKKKPIVKK